MNYQHEMFDIAAENGGIITNMAAKDHGISRATLYNLNRKGIISRIAQGQYIDADDLQDDFLSIAVRSSNIILSHETELGLHGLSERTPFVHKLVKEMVFKMKKMNLKMHFGKP